jgi:hypothetical protein
LALLIDHEYLAIEIEQRLGAGILTNRAGPTARSNEVQ